MVYSYEALANAIIKQAVKDYRSATRFLKKNSRTKELEEKVIAEQAEREKRREELKEKNQPLPRMRKSRDERLLDRIISHETLRYDTEKFFRSEWFGILSDLDGVLLLKRIKEMEE